MKKLLLTSLLTLSFGISNSAFAESNFDGIYAGLAAGRAYSEDKGAEYKDYGSSSYDATQYTAPSGALFSLFTGVNKVVDKNILFGAEADYEKRNYSDDTSQRVGQTLDPQYPISTKVKNGGSLRARLGYIFNDDKTLAYVTAGYARLKVERVYGDSNNVEGNGTSMKNSSRQNGFVAGFGLEHFLTSKISLRAEYRYAKYDKKTIDASLIYGAGTLEKQKLSDQSIRVGIAYNF